MPALKVYKEHLGERVLGLPATDIYLPLAIRKNANDRKRLIRTMLTFNEEDESLTYASDVPMGHLAQLMYCNSDRVIMAADAAGKIASTALNKSISKLSLPILAIAISSAGRRLLLGQRAAEETKAVIDVLPKGTKQMGFYSYGELSSLASNNCDLNNQIISVTTISEG